MATQSNPRTPDTKRSIGTRWEEYQPAKSTLLWACVVSVAATLVVGFTWGGWVTGATADEQASVAGDIAHGELASLICVERFNATPDSNAQLSELESITSSYERRRFIEAGGWATMPGETSASRRGADGCADALTSS
ncbi:hypothetical protein [Amorphus sp. 3PC139-8]|uniref:hypothetical protein n=1 Tax=Amorphus sp. 3PC139-8 TaxID=2735676 RepID=UPI00345C91A2